MFLAPFSQNLPDSHMQRTCEQPSAPAKCPGESCASLTSAWLICTHSEDRSCAGMTTPMTAAFHSPGTGIISWAQFDTSSDSTFGQLWAESRSLSSWNTGWFCAVWSGHQDRLENGCWSPEALIAGKTPPSALTSSLSVLSPRSGLSRKFSLLQSLHGLRGQETFPVITLFPAW